MSVAKWVLILTLVYNGNGATIETIHGFQDSASCRNAGQIWSNQITGKGRYQNSTAITTRDGALGVRYACIPLDSMDDPRPTVLRGPKNPNVLDEETLTRIKYGDQ